MIYSISPLVKVAPSNALRTTVYCVTLVGVSTVLFASLASTGSPARLGSLALPIVSALAIAYALRQFGLLALPLPSSHWQVPRSWISRGSWQGAALYGASMGVGFLTRAPFPTYHLVVLWMIIDGVPAHGAIAGLCFGGGRAAALFVPRLLARDASRSHVARTEILYRNIDLVQAINGLVLGFAGGLLPVLAIGRLTA